MNVRLGLIAVLCLLPLSAFGAGKQPVELHDYLMKRGDHNKDGSLSEREVVVMRKEFVARMTYSIKKASPHIDLPINGFVSTHPLRYAELANAVFFKVKEKIDTEVIDGDGDKIVTRDELKTYVDAVQDLYRVEVAAQVQVAAAQAAAEAAAAAAARARKAENDKDKDKTKDKSDKKDKDDGPSRGNNRGGGNAGGGGGGGGGAAPSKGERMERGVRGGVKK